MGATPPPPPTVSVTPGERGGAVHTKEMRELLVRTEDSSLSSPVLTIFLSFRRGSQAQRCGAEQAERGTAEEDRGDPDEAAECKFSSLISTPS